MSDWSDEGESSPQGESLMVVDVSRHVIPDDVHMAEENDDDDDDDSNKESNQSELCRYTSQSVHLRSVREALQHWTIRHQATKLDEMAFRSWWRLQVPRLLSPISRIDYRAPEKHLDESEIAKQLLKPLEDFILIENAHSIDNSSEENIGFQQLAKLGTQSGLCGRLFSVGEPSYSCRDCAMDTACVMCVDCFNHSEHKKHRYKINRSSTGGGFCDCGDKEAWKSHHVCSLHEKDDTNDSMKEGSLESEASDLLDRLPTHVRDRGRIVFRSVLRYVFEMVTLDCHMALPSSLRCDEVTSIPTSSSLYATLLYNDEYHSYEELINALPRAVDCDRATAIGYATLTDREGRALVKCSSFQSCTEVKRIMERITSRSGGRPLKVVIMHIHVLAHQSFALKLIDWMQKLLNKATSLRGLFAQVMQENFDEDKQEQDDVNGSGLRRVSPKTTLAEMFFRADTRLWKRVRSQLHHLFITGMLMDGSSKREFAKLFSRNYGSMMKDFIADDHDHAFSITALSLQLFSVPSIAHDLIRNKDIFALLMTTFASEIERKRNERGRIDFQRNINVQSFRRSFYILHDVIYLLSTPPQEWDNGLRKHFLHGFTVLCQILSWMQGMDGQVRQTSSHVEYELKWDTGFHLHMKMAPIFNLVASWCSSDRLVLIKAVRIVLKQLQELLHDQNLKTETQQVCGHRADCVDYAVGSREISLHQPLSRLLTGNLALLLSKFDLSLLSYEFDLPLKPSLIHLMEPSLRCAAVSAQVRSGMWRRNGYAMMDQISVYQQFNVRKEMLDRDVLSLQVMAANLDPNEFVIHLLNKFMLVNWARQDFDVAEDESIRQMATVAEEFLTVLIVVLSERYQVGVGEGIGLNDVIRHEVIQLLCIEPMPHSTLNKALPEDSNRETGLDRVIDQVANYKPPRASAAKGIYELKPQFYEEYNVFFYHYSKEKQSLSEQAQMRRRKASNQSECCPPTLPPKFSKAFSNITKLLSSDVFLYILALMLQRAENLKSRCFSEGQVHRTIHLIGLALLEEQRMKEEMGTLKMDHQTSEWFSTKAERDFDLLRLLEQLVCSQRIEGHRELVKWVISLWKTVTGKEEEEKLLSKEPKRNEEEDEAKRKKRAAMAAERKAKLMAQMKSAQSNFIKNNEQHYSSTEPNAPSRSGSEAGMTTATVESMDTSKGDEDALICVGSNRSRALTTENEFICILCQESERVGPQQRPLVMAALVQKSTVLNRRRKHLNEDKNKDEKKSINDTNSSRGSSGGVLELQTAQYLDFPLLSSHLCCSPHISSCGHLMHSSCWQKYFDEVLVSENRRSRLRYNQSFDVDNKEYLCPLCRCLSNTAIPVIPQYHLLQRPDGQSNDGQVEKKTTETLTTERWLKAVSAALRLKTQQESSSAHDLNADMEMRDVSTANPIRSSSNPFVTASSSLSPETSTTASTSLKLSHQVRRFTTCSLSNLMDEHLKSTLSDYESNKFASFFIGQTGNELQFNSAFFEMINLLTCDIFRVGLDTLPDLQDERLPLVAWQTCAFSIHASVWATLDRGQNIFNATSRLKDCLGAFVRFCGVVGSNFGDASIIRSHALRMLSTLLEVDTANYSILEADAFGMLVVLTFALPSLFNAEHAAPLPAANEQDQHLLKLVLAMHMVQIVLTTDLHDMKRDANNDDEDAISMENKVGASTMSVLSQLVRLVQQARCSGDEEDEEDDESAPNFSSTSSLSSLWRHLKRSSLPFVRCAALFYHHLSGVPAPPEPKSVSKLMMDEEVEFYWLMNYLGLKAEELLTCSSSLPSLAQRWCNHPSVLILLSPAALEPPLSYPMQVNSLIKLPYEYGDLMNSVSLFKCPHMPSNLSRYPSLCLLCGQVLCSHCYSCQVQLGDGPVGACTAHAHRCGAGSGFFLRVRDCMLVLLANRNKGCVVPAPYVDKYGEADMGLKRGNPLFLCQTSLRGIHKIWINHRIPEELANAVETNQALPWGIPWESL